MSLTTEQSKAIDVVKTSPATQIRARAGSGKTWLGAKMAETYPRKRWQFIVFNKKNAEEFNLKLPSNATGSTAHSFCRKFIKNRPKLDSSGNKVFRIIFKDIDYNFKQDGLTKEETLEIRENLNAMKDLVGLMKNSYVDPKVDDVIYLIDHFGIQFTLPIDQVCSDAIRFLKESDDITNEIDFNDMIRFPIISKQIKPSFDYFFLDEAQDNTPIRNEMLRQMKEAGCQVICVGDEFQAIYGFSGADSDSMSRIQEAIHPIILPLTVNFRCGKNIIKQAQTIVPDIQAWENSIDGEVLALKDTDEFMKTFQYGDVALSRFNKIIIPICFRLIKSGKKATIQGRDFGSMLKGMVSAFKATSIDEFYTQLERWQERQLKHSKTDSATDAINDRFECLKFFADNCDTVEQIGEKIDLIFKEDQGEGFKLSTVHKSKGLEFRNTFILDNSNFMKTHPNMKSWEYQQLKNLYYVAMTRAKEKLIFVP